VGYLHRQVPSKPPVAPPGVVQMRVSFDRNVEPARDEWFLKGTEMSAVHLAADASGASARSTSYSPPHAQNAQSAAPGIGSPTDGTVFALDPDIPPERQRIVFERANGASTRSLWRLDGKPLGHAERVLWLPWPGRHLLELVDAQGASVDAVHFEVRGATARTAAAPEPQRQSRAEGRRPVRAAARPLGHETNQ
jgi:penicillin-binding protein 1C